LPYEESTRDKFSLPTHSLSNNAVCKPTESFVSATVVHGAKRHRAKREMMQKLEGKEEK
jgi:hypothetical protein